MVITDVIEEKIRYLLYLKDIDGFCFEKEEYIVLQS